MTCPVGVKLEFDWFTFAVKVTSCPVPAVGRDDASAVVVGTCGDTTVRDPWLSAAVAGKISESCTVTVMLTTPATVGRYCSVLPTTWSVTFGGVAVAVKV